jgi:hypothetical protein
MIQNPDFKIGSQMLETTVGVVKLFSVSESIVIKDVDKFGSRNSYAGRCQLYSDRTTYCRYN